MLKDIVIYGATLEGLLLSRLLSKAGISNVVLEPSDRKFGFLSPLVTRGTPINNPHHFIPHEEPCLSLLSWIQEALDFKIEFFSNRLPRATMEKGSLAPFIGFGENLSTEYDIFKGFYPENQIIFSSKNPLFEEETYENVEVLHHSHITGFSFSEEGLHEIFVNEKNLYHAKHFIFACDPLEFAHIFMKEPSLQRPISRITKSKTNGLLQIICAHDLQQHPNQGAPSRFILTGAPKRPFLFIGEISEPGSCWLSSLREEVHSDDQEVALIIREMKKQILNLPLYKEKPPVFEKISIYPNTSGVIDLKATETGSTGISNLTLVSHRLLTGSSPLLNSISAVQRSSESLLKSFSKKESVPSSNGELFKESPRA